MEDTNPNSSPPKSVLQLSTLRELTAQARLKKDTNPNSSPPKSVLLLSTL
jgi:hypothetical protein